MDLMILLVVVICFVEVERVSKNRCTVLQLLIDLFGYQGMSAVYRNLYTDARLSAWYVGVDTFLLRRRAISHDHGEGSGLRMSSSTGSLSNA